MGTLRANAKAELNHARYSEHILLFCYTDWSLFNCLRPERGDLLEDVFLLKVIFSTLVPPDIQQTSAPQCISNNEEAPTQDHAQVVPSLCSALWRASETRNHGPLDNKACCASVDLYRLAKKPRHIWRIDPIVPKTPGVPLGWQQAKCPLFHIKGPLWQLRGKIQCNPAPSVGMIVAFGFFLSDSYGFHQP